MRCRLAQSLMDEYVEGTLNPTTQAQLEEHLAGCLECRTLLEQKRQSRSLATRVVSQEIAATPPQGAPIGGASFRPEPAVTEQYAPTQSKEADMLRRQLESIGVIMPDPGSVINSEEPSTAVLPLPAISPLDSLFSRFRLPEEAPVTEKEHQQSAANEMPLETPLATGVTAPPANEEHPNNFEAPLPTLVPLPLSTTAPPPPPSSSEDDWVTIVVTHHVTRSQVQRRVRRDSLEARRYFAERSSRESEEGKLSEEESGSLLPFATGGSTWPPDNTPIEDTSSQEPLPLPDPWATLPSQEQLVQVNESYALEEVLEPLDEIDPEASPLPSFRELPETPEEEPISEEPGVSENDEDEEMIPDIEITLPEPYNLEGAIALPRSVPNQTNPVVRSPAEIGRERLTQQSRLVRDQQQVIVRHSGATLSGQPFTRMRWQEQIQGHPAVMILIIILLVAALLFLAGMFVSQYNSPLATTRRQQTASLQQEVAQLAQHLQEQHQWMLTISDNPLPEISVSLIPAAECYPRLNSLAHRQVEELRAINRQVAEALALWLVERQLPIANLNGEAFWQQMQKALPKLYSYMAAQNFPLSGTQEQNLQTVLEPVATLAFRYITSGDPNCDPPAPLLSADLLAAYVVDFAAAYGLQQRREAERIVRRLENYDIWHLFLTTDHWHSSEGYDMLWSDTPPAFYALTPTPDLLANRGAAAIHLSSDPLLLEQWLNLLAGKDELYYYLGSHGALGGGSEVGYHFYIPGRHMRLFPSE
ncbi:MAG: zf-HC2 domain-containing protein, partial [Symbiobacteriaceae bacterium]|nr:zf-HC2 domain-containing protein [Symbiobacteriaceae bacterium]